jgi:NADPH:quinone reductase-like Zn-dependent oxidoreductase
VKTMRAIIARDRAAGIDGLALAGVPYPHAAENDVIVRVHAAGFTPGELDWPGTWTDRAGRDRTPTTPGHEVSGEVVELGYGTTGLTVGQRVFGVTDWCRNGTLAEFVAVEARNLAPLSAGLTTLRLRRYRFQVSRHGRDCSPTAISGPGRPS